jgi:hypothetical protein
MQANEWGTLVDRLAALERVLAADRAARREDAERTLIQHESKGGAD